MSPYIYIVNHIAYITTSIVVYFRDHITLKGTQMRVKYLVECMIELLIDEFTMIDIHVWLIRQVENNATYVLWKPLIKYSK